MENVLNLRVNAEEKEKNAKILAHIQKPLVVEQHLNLVSMIITVLLINLSDVSMVNAKNILCN